MFRKTVKSIAVIGMALTMMACTVNKPAEQSRTVTVSGSGSAAVATYEAISLKFFVRTNEWNVNTAIQRNNEAAARVKEAIVNAGVDSNDISIGNYKVTQDNSLSYPGRYTVLNSVDVLLRNFDLTGAVIDAAVTYSINTPNSNKANGLSDFEYKIIQTDDKTTAKREARTEAVKNAQNAANLLAGASGCKVDSVLEIIETNASEVIAEDGTSKVISEVKITYSLIN